jgi:transposase-like protein/IS1 family transposase
MMECQKCNGETKRFGKDRKGQQRYRCLSCKVTFIDPAIKRVDGMLIPEDKALLCLQLLVEGNSVRSTERITGVHRDTILDLLVMVGEKCERMMEDRIKGLTVKDVQADEIWGFIGMKHRAKAFKGIEDDSVGDSWTFVAIERHSKLVLAWHLGQRSRTDTIAFTEKIAHATTGSFQISTDGFAAYKDAVVYSLGGQYVDFAQLVKVYASPRDGEQRYSPAECVDCVKVPIHGNPDPERICTSHIERQNLTIRMGMRRMTRLTNGFSKKWENHHAHLALHFAYYNFVRVHSTLRVTPAMEAGITDHIWTLAELLRH